MLQNSIGIFPRANHVSLHSYLHVTRAPFDSIATPYSPPPLAPSPLRQSFSSTRFEIQQADNVTTVDVMKQTKPKVVLFE